MSELWIPYIYSQLRIGVAKIVSRVQLGLQKLIPCVSETGIHGHSWLRPDFACSIPDVVIGIYRGINPTGRHMELGSIQPLTEISMRDIF